jgi:hypothetical protein
MLKYIPFNQYFDDKGRTKGGLEHMNGRTTLLLCGLLLAAGCAEEVQPPSVQEYLDDPNSLEAAVVRCSMNRSETRYNAECVNARQAISIIEAKEERARRAAFEAESDKKRQALRRTQQAAAEARRRAEEMERQRKEAEYLAQFGELPPRDEPAEESDVLPGNAPAVVIPETDDTLPSEPYEEAPAIDGGNAPVVEPAPETVPEGDLDAVREELRRRAEESGSQ